ncbi:MAG: hypothetical protein V1779_14770 [bacterium]
MKKHILVALVLITITISGCLVLSLYPIYTEDTLVKLDGLEGTWMQNDSSSWSFKLDTTQLYKVTINEFERTISSPEENSSDTTFKFKGINEYSGGLTKINGVYFLDLLPEKINDSSGSIHSIHFIYGHSISKLQMKGDSLLIVFLDYDWINDSKKKIKKSVGYIKSEKNAILTASTKDLRKFLSKFANDTNAFPENDNYMIKVKK